MSMIDNLILGFATAATFQNLIWCFVGCVLGTLIGVLPGLGPAATIAMLLPFTFTLGPGTALIMLAGIYYGAQYGGSTTAILVNLPGESSSVVTAIDGYKMAQQGRAGLALSTAAIGSFVAGSLATLVIALFAPALSEAALSFTAPEYFSLMALGLILSIVLASGSLLNSIGMIVVGLLLGVIGLDKTSGVPRFAFGIDELADGLGVIPVAMGMFGLGEIIHNLQSHDGQRTARGVALSQLVPTRDEIRQITPPILRGTLVGSLLGVLPGGGALLSSFASYAIEKKVARDPSRFGHGAIEGVAGPESANNAGAQTSFIPLLTLGIPSNVVMALMTGALIIHGVQPGPGLVRDHAPIFWGVIASMWIGNAMLLILNLPLIGLWVRLLTIPYALLYPAIIVFCAIGVFTLSSSVVDVYIMVGFGLLGFVFRMLEAEPAPLLLGMVLGPLMEENLRRALLISRGDPMIFVTRPISAALLALAAVALVVVMAPAIRSKRDEALKEE